MLVVVVLVDIIVAAHIFHRVEQVAAQLALAMASR